MKPTAVWGVVKELRTAAEDFRPLVVSGAPEHAGALRAALVEGGDGDAVRDLTGRAPTRYDVEGARVLVHVVDGARPGEEDEHALRLAARAGVELVCVLAGVPSGEVPDVPYVLATDVVSVGPGEPLPLDALWERIADRAGDASHELAARLPALRPAVVDSIVRSFSLQNGVLAVAVFVPGADFPVLTLNQIRMVLRIAAAHGEQIDRERALEVLPVVAAALGFRTLARHLVGSVPGFGWALKGGVAFAATRAVGEAAAAYFAAGWADALARSVRSRS